MRIVFICLFFLYNFSFIYAQAVDSIQLDTIIEIIKPIKKKTVPAILPNDSISLNYFELGNVYKKKLVTDTLIETIQYYNPALIGIYANLGNMGSAHTPFYYQAQKNIGFRIGLNQFDRYLYKIKNLKFYNTDRPFTDLFYSQGLGQNNTQFQGAFAKNFTRGIHFSIEYQKIIHQLSSEIQFNQNAVYKTQTAATSSLITGFWYQSKTNRYNAFLSFNSNYVEQRNHGGVAWNSDVAIQIDTASNGVPFSVPRLLSNDQANTRNSSKKIALKQLYQLSSLYKGNALVIAYDASYQTSSYKFYDNDPDSSFYKSFFVDKRGLRHLIKDNLISNEIDLKWVNHKNKGSKSLLSIGILHQLHHLTQEPITSNIQDLFATSTLNLPISKYGLLSANGKLGLANSTGDIKLDGFFTLNTLKFGQLNFGGYLTRSQPNAIQKKLFISSQSVWNNEFNRVVSFGINGSYTYPKYKFSISAHTHTLNNFIFLNQHQIFEQSSDLMNIFQLSIQKNFKFGIFHSNNKITFQQAAKLIPLPSLILQNSLFIQTKIFKKKMLTKVGIDFLYIKGYKAKAYNPLLGTFYLQNKTMTPEFPSIDAFLNIKVQNFKAFFKLENIYGQFTSDVYYQIPHYLKREMDFRFGIYWDFWDQKRQNTKSKNINKKPENLKNL